MAVPVAVVGWAVLFSVDAAKNGPAWAKGQLRRVSIVMAILLGFALVATAFVRPSWLGLGAAYPLAIGSFLAWGRWRQLTVVEREIGFGEIDERLRRQVLARLQRGLAVTGLIGLVAGLGLVATGIPHGWIVAVLAPIAGIAMAKSRSGLGSTPSNQWTGPPSL